LKRIAEALKGKSLPQVTRVVESAEAVEPSAPRTVSASVRAVAEAVSEPQPAELLHAPEPRFPATEPAAGPLDWLRAKRPVTTPVPSAPVPPAMAETPMVDLTDEAPLSPRPPQRSAMPSGVEPSVEPKNWSPTRDAGPFDFRPAERTEQSMTRSTPQVEPTKEKERFDLVWPDRAAAPAPAPAEPKVEAKREPAFDMPMPPVPARPRETRLAAERRIPEVARKPVVERGPAILKSGVIDGMPYTLYADGSIEAQLAQGMVKFASVDALRAHLEKQS